MSATTENTVTLYRTTCTKGYVASVDLGSGYNRYGWGDDTTEYEGFDDGGHEYVLPAGYCAAEGQGGWLGIAGPDNMMCHILSDGQGLPAIVGPGGDLITLRRAPEGK